MMSFGGGWLGWFGPLIMLGMLVGVVLIVVWAVNAGGRRNEDDARGNPNIGLIGLVLVVAAIVLGMLMGSVMPGGWGWMTGPGGMMGLGAGPTAPAGTSVRMAGSRFEPSTLTISSGETVRWFNDDALPHTVSASDAAWDSGNLAPGQSFERRFDESGSYPYVCLYHAGMAGSIEVEA